MFVQESSGCIRGSLFRHHSGLSIAATRRILCGVFRLTECTASFHSLRQHANHQIRSGPLRMSSLPDVKLW